MTILKDAEGWDVWGVVENGDLPGFPSVQVNMRHPPMHMFTSEELIVKGGDKMDHVGGSTA